MEIEVYTPEESFQQFFYQGMHIKEACWINGVPYFTRRAIGEFLEYHNPQKSIDKIIERNPQIDQFSTTVSLTVVEGTREVIRETRVYNPIGLQLIIFESRQPKAKAFKIIVANLVWAYSQGRLAAPEKSALYNELKDIVFLKRWTKERRQAVEQLAEKLDISVDTIYRKAIKVENNEPLIKPRPKRCAIYRNKEAREKVLRIHKRFPHIKKEELALAANVHTATIYRWLSSQWVNK